MNRLNEYGSRDVPGAMDVLGAATSIAPVWVNSSTNGVYRRGEYFRKQVDVSNGGNPVWQGVSAYAWDGTNYSGTESGNVFVAQTAEAFTHDADGNLLTDGRWTYTWDAENRLVQMVARTAVGPQQCIRFEYDWQGRRIRKQVWNNTAGTGTPALDQKFLYDGWNLRAELNTTNNAPVRSFLWGSDLSGTMQGAGGVGGLLAVFQHEGANGGAHFCAFDGNGNIVALVKATDGNTSARYEFGPFGELIRRTGVLGKANPFRFSTKYQDEETDLHFYGFRYYSPSMGRWLSRDPIAENGGENLHGFNYNAPEQYIDTDGAISVSPLRLAMMIANWIANQLASDRHDTWIRYDVTCPKGSGKYLVKEERREISRRATVTVGRGLSTASQSVADTVVRTRTIQIYDCCKSQGCFTRNTTAWSVNIPVPTHQDISTKINIHLQINDPHVWVRVSARETTQDSMRSRSCLEHVDPTSKDLFMKTCSGPWYNRSCSKWSYLGGW